MDNIAKEWLRVSLNYMRDRRASGYSESAEKQHGSRWDREEARIEAILTAEPEPCEEAREIAEYAQDRLTHDGGDIMLHGINDVASRIATYATQVADKRPEELRKLKEACEPFRIAFHEHGKFQYEGEYYNEDIGKFNDLNQITPYGVTMGDFRRLYEALESTEPKP